MTNSAAAKKTDSQFEHDVLEFVERLRAFVRSRVGHPQDAEDLAQDVFLKIFRSKNALRDPARLHAWLYRTARRTITDYYRRREENEPLPESLSAESQSLDEVGQLLHTAVKRFVLALPPLYREPLTRAEFKGQRVAEIAAELGISESAVKSRLSRGRRLLREYMLECCRFEFDRFGKVIDFQRHGVCGCEGECESAHPGDNKATMGNLSIGLAGTTDAEDILKLLKATDLPTADLSPEVLLNFLLARAEDHLVGCAGLEPIGKNALIRSVSVAPDWRGAGLGRRLVREVESLSGMLHVEHLYLLTTTAKSFFAANGYTKLSRSKAPAAIRTSSEFSTLCPANAVLMHKRIPHTVRPGSK